MKDVFQKARFWWLAHLLSISVCLGVGPDHPIITEVYTDPPGATDGPVGRDPTNLHQSFIEIYIPPLLDISLLLNKDSLDLTIYEVEGDKNSGGGAGAALVNYRLDLPTLDIDPSNGTTVGALAVPADSAIVLGWVDYLGNPATALATPETALINDGMVAVSPDFTFIAINGNHFQTTSVFPAIQAENLIDTGGPDERISGILQNGSSVFLLVNRDAAGYRELCDDQHAGDCVPFGADPALDTGLVLGVDALLDGFASNDDFNFDFNKQPLPLSSECAGNVLQCVDHEMHLFEGSPFSLLVPQISESNNGRLNPGVANGYARVLVDQLKTTENASPVDDDPVADATFAYRHVRNAGPFFPSPGKATATTSDPEFTVADATEQFVDVLSGTETCFPGVLCANVGGITAIDMSVTSVGISTAANVATFAAGPPATAVAGPALGFPALAVTTGAGASVGMSASVPVSVAATNSAGGGAVNALPLPTSVTVTIIEPTMGQDEIGMPFQATVFAAVQAVPSDALVTNEFLNTDLGSFVQANLGVQAQDTIGNGSVLVDPTFNLLCGNCIHAGCNVPACAPCNPNIEICAIPQLVKGFPDLAADFINLPGPIGGLDLLQTVQTSAEELSSGTYTENISLLSQGVRAVRLNTPDTTTFGGSFSPSEIVHFVDGRGRFDDPSSGLSTATTARTFEIAIVDTNTRVSSTQAIPDIENGNTDDFGIVVEVLDIESNPMPPVAVGEFVFLSFSGGRQGADIDGLNVAPGNNVANIIFLDLDNLHDVLGIISIELVTLIDGGGNTGQADIIEVFSLNPVGVAPLQGACCDGVMCTLETPASCALIAGGVFQGGSTDCIGNPCDDGACCLDNESCVASTSQTACLQMAGANTFTLGADCLGVDCNTGACCDGVTCTIETAAECSALAGTYLGDASTCAGDPCARGACCDGFSCSVGTEAICNLIPGSRYLGDDTNCAGSPCDDGACCLDNESCVPTADEAACLIMAGANTFTLGGTCLDVDCNTGACCVGMTCTVETADECVNVLGGAYQGDTSECVGEVCTVPDCTRDCDCYTNMIAAGTPPDVCDYHYCEAGQCLSCKRRFGNTCAIFNGFVGTDDILCAVEGFGNYCACPNADLWNSSAPGCSVDDANCKGPDGIPVSTADILAIVSAFGGDNPFSCDQEPQANRCDDIQPPASTGCGAQVTAASHGIVDVSNRGRLADEAKSIREERFADGADSPRIILRSSQRVIRPNGVVHVDIFASGVQGLVGYQFGIRVDGGREGRLHVDSLEVSTHRGDYVFHGLQGFPAVDQELDRIGGVVVGPGVSVFEDEMAYIGTATLRASGNAVGAFTLTAAWDQTGLWTDGNVPVSVNTIEEVAVMVARNSRDAAIVPTSRKNR